MIIQVRPRTGTSDVTFTGPRATLSQAMHRIEQGDGTIGYSTKLTKTTVAKISAVGVGMSPSRRRRKMFQTLGRPQDQHPRRHRPARSR